MNRRSFFRNVAVVAAGSLAAVKGLDVAAREPTPAVLPLNQGAPFAPLGHVHGNAQPNLVQRDNSGNFTAGTLTANGGSTTITNVSGVPAENSAVWTGEQWAGLHSHSITIPALTGDVTTAEGLARRP
jgi:hypothetical protein